MFGIQLLNGYRVFIGYYVYIQQKFNGRTYFIKEENFVYQIMISKKILNRFYETNLVLVRKTLNWLLFSYKSILSKVFYTLRASWWLKTSMLRPFSNSICVLCELQYGISSPLKAKESKKIQWLTKTWNVCFLLVCLRQW